MWHFTGTKTFSGALRTTMSLFLLSACVFAMAACDNVSNSHISESNTTSGSVGPFVETSNIWLRATSFPPTPYFPGNGGILIDLDRADTLEPLRVGSGDTLQVTLNGVSQFIEEVRDISCSGKIGPCSYIYYYRVLFSENPESQPLTLSLERVTGVSSHTTTTFPPRPTISEPTAGMVISLSTDTLSISWQPGEPGDETRLTVSGDCGVYNCGVYKQLWFMDADSAYSFAPGSFSIDPEFCVNATELPLPLHTTRYRTYAADPALAPISFVELSLEDEITVQMRP